MDGSCPGLPPHDPPEISAGGEGGGSYPLPLRVAPAPHLPPFAPPGGLPIRLPAALLLHEGKDRSETAPGDPRPRPPAPFGEGWSYGGRGFSRHRSASQGVVIRTTINPW